MLLLFLPMPATQFGSYQLERRLAVGGTAEVYRARAPAGAGPGVVVLKRLLPQHLDDPRFREIFSEEARLAAKLEHENIVRLVDSGEVRGVPFLVLEYIDGADLSSLLRKTNAKMCPRVPLDVALHLIERLAQALIYLYTAQDGDGRPICVVHRDISPHNILLSRKGEVKLADFGIALHSQKETRTADGTIKGKLAYMSPEQAMASRDLDARSDIFSLGCVLYEMMFGQSPFWAASDIETLESVRMAKYQLDRRRLACDPVAELIEGCLKRDPNERFADPQALCLEIQRARVAVGIGPARVERWVQSLLGDPPANVATEPDSAERKVALLDQHLIGGAGYTALLPGASGRSGSTAPSVELATLPAATSAVSTPLPEARPPRLPRWVFVMPIAAVLVLGAALLLVFVPSSAERRAHGPPIFADARPADARPTDVAVTTVPSVDAASRATRPSAISADAQPTRRRPTASRSRAIARSRHARQRRGRLTRPVAPKAPAKRQMGFLTVNSLPWARVYVDRRYIGNTPIIRRSLPVGDHRIELRDAGGRRMRYFKTEIRMGQTTTHSFSQRR